MKTKMKKERKKDERKESLVGASLRHWQCHSFPFFLSTPFLLTVALVIANKASVLGGFLVTSEATF